jgi:hypothetical protein
VKIFSRLIVIHTTEDTNRTADTNPSAGVIGGKVQCTKDLFQLLNHGKLLQCA